MYTLRTHVLQPARSGARARASARFFGGGRERVSRAGSSLGRWRCGSCVLRALCAAFARLGRLPG